MIIFHDLLYWYVIFSYLIFKKCNEQMNKLIFTQSELLIQYNNLQHPELSLGITIWKNFKCPKDEKNLHDNAKNFRYHLLVLKKIVLKPGHFPMHHSIKGKIMVCPWERKRVYLSFHAFHIFLSICPNISKSQRFNMTFLDWDSCLNYSFREVLSNPKSMCSSPFNCNAI